MTGTSDILPDKAGDCRTQGERGLATGRPTLNTFKNCFTVQPSGAHTDIEHVQIYASSESGGVIIIGGGPMEVYSMEARIARQGIYGTACPATSLVTWHFRDFELRYLGTKNMQILKFTVPDYQFVAKTHQGEVPISWNSGLGDIAPRPFKIDGHTYFLEMESSELLGQWIKGKFVVYPDNDPALAVRWPHYALAHLVPLQSALSLQTPGIGGIRLAYQPYVDLSIGRLESGKSSCGRWYTLPGGQSEWLLPPGDYCLQPGIGQPESRFKVIEGQTATVGIF